MQDYGNYKLNHDENTLTGIMGLTKKEFDDLSKQTVVVLNNFDDTIITDEVFALLLLKSFNDMDEVRSLVGVILLGIYGEDRVRKPSQMVEIMVNAIQDQNIRKMVIVNLEKTYELYNKKPSTRDILEAILK
jgi:hypothetical protein